jgi:hypothetical protein
MIRILLQALCPELPIVITMAAKQSAGSQVFWQDATAVPKHRRTENAYGDIESHVWNSFPCDFRISPGHLQHAHQAKFGYRWN